MSVTNFKVKMWDEFGFHVHGERYHYASDNGIFFLTTPRYGFLNEASLFISLLGDLTKTESFLRENLSLGPREDVFRAGSIKFPPGDYASLKRLIIATEKLVHEAGGYVTKNDRRIRKVEKLLTIKEVI